MEKRKNELDREYPSAYMKLLQLFRDKNTSKWIIVFFFAAAVFIAISNLRNSFPAVKQQSKKMETMDQQKPKTDELSYSEQYRHDMEEQLKMIVKKIVGGKSTEVMISLKASKEVIYAREKIEKDSQSRETDGSGYQKSEDQSEIQEHYVVGGDQNTKGNYLVTKEYFPEIEGVVIVAEGLNDTLILEIHEAVQALFSVESHKIKVLRMSS